MEAFKNLQRNAIFKDNIAALISDGRRRRDQM